MVTWGYVFFCFHLQCLGDFGTHKGDWKTQSVSRRLSDNPGELELMHKSPTDSFSQFYVETMKQLGVLILPLYGMFVHCRILPQLKAWILPFSWAGMGTDISSCKFTISTGVIKILLVASITWKREERFLFLWRRLVWWGTCRNFFSKAIDWGLFCIFLLYWFCYIECGFFKTVPQTWKWN